MNSKKAFNQGGVMIRTSAIMVRVPWWDSLLVKFVNSDYDEPAEDRGRRRKLFLDIEDWKEMGEPDVITNYTEPGDKLNELNRRRVAMLHEAMSHERIRLDEEDR